MNHSMLSNQTDRANVDSAEEICNLLSRRQVARLLGVHTETIKRYQRRGLLPAIVLNSRLVRYERIAVEKLLERGRVG